MRRKLAGEYSHVRELDADVLLPAAGENGEASLRLSALSIAVLDGLGLQLALDPDTFDHDGAYDLWCTMVSTLLEKSSSEGSEEHRP